MKIQSEAQEKINQIQIFEQNLHSLISQKQNFQAQEMEIETSLLELSRSNKAYRIIGNIMIESNTDDLKKDLTTKKEMLDIRIKSIEKQEDKLKQKISDAQKEVMESMKK